MDIGLVISALLVGSANVFTFYKVEILAELIAECFLLWKCKPYIIYPWSRNGIPSKSSVPWLLVHVVVGMAQLNISALRIWIFDYRHTRQGILLEKVAKVVWYVFCAIILTNFWRFGNLGFVFGSIANLLPLAAVFFTYNDNPHSDNALILRWLNFLSTWVAPGFEIVQYFFFNH